MRRIAHVREGYRAGLEAIERFKALQQGSR